jgi:hypothetical protein
MNLAEWITVKILFEHCQNKFFKERFVYNRAITRIPYMGEGFEFNVGPRGYRVEFQQIYDEIRCVITLDGTYPWHDPGFVIDRRELYQSIINRGINE